MVSTSPITAGNSISSLWNEIPPETREIVKKVAWVALAALALAAIVVLVIHCPLLLGVFGHLSHSLHVGFAHALQGVIAHSGTFISLSLFFLGSAASLLIAHRMYSKKLFKHHVDLPNMTNSYQGFYGGPAHADKCQTYYA